MQRIKKCDKCQKDFIQKWVNREKHWSQLNQVNYWTDGKKWENYSLFCRSCLNNWFEFERENFNELVDNETKKRLYFTYRGHGVFNKTDHLDK